jgi:hypothetical protein
MDRVQLFNEIVRASRAIGVPSTDATSLDQKLSEVNLDSLDTLLVSIYYCDVYGISEEKAKKLQPKTLMEIYEFIDQNKTREPKTMEEALKKIR